MGSSSWYEDAADLVTCYYMTQILKQPYRNLIHDIRGEERIVERAIGIGVSSFTEAIAIFGDKLNVQPA